MSSAAEFDPGTEVLIEDGRARRGSRLARRELWANVFPGTVFLVVAGLLVLLAESARSPAPWTVVLLVGAYAIAYRIEFEVGSGLAVPTQILFVPMLFVLPLGLVPFAVAAGIMLANIAEILEGRIQAERVFVRLGNAFYSLGPVLVLAAFGEADPTLRDWPIYLVALGAQFAFEFASAATHERLALGVSLRLLLGYMSVTWAVDAALAPVGLLTALAAVEDPAALLLVLPLAGLLRTFARERRARVDNALELSHAYRGTALLLGDVVEADDAYTGSHSRDVVSLSISVAEELGLDARGRRDTEFVALLHDVGKIRIPNEIINKPGPLTPEERAIDRDAHGRSARRCSTASAVCSGTSGTSCAPATSGSTAAATRTGSRAIRSRSWRGSSAAAMPTARSRPTAPTVRAARRPKRSPSCGAAPGRSSTRTSSRRSSASRPPLSDYSSSPALIALRISCRFSIAAPTSPGSTSSPRSTASATSRAAR